MYDSFLVKLKKQPLVRKAWSDKELNLFYADHVCTAPATRLKVGINDFEHIRRFEQTASWLTRDSFLSFAKDNCDQPNRYILTVADADGPLLGYSLAEADSVQSDFGAVEQCVRWPRGTATLFGSYVHPRARGHGIHNILRIARINFMIGELGMSWAVGAVEGDNLSAMRSALKASYFKMFATLRTRYRLGFAKRSVQVIDNAFKAEYEANVSVM